VRAARSRDSMKRVADARRGLSWPRIKRMKCRKRRVALPPQRTHKKVFPGFSLHLGSHRGSNNHQMIYLRARQTDSDFSSHANLERCRNVCNSQPPDISQRGNSSLRPQCANIARHYLSKCLAYLDCASSELSF
jgi:hypothetical protein